MTPHRSPGANAQLRRFCADLGRLLVASRPAEGYDEGPGAPKSLVGRYDSYAKNVLRETFGDRFDTSDIVFSFGANAGTGEVDGIIDDNIAVEIGVGSPKQIRGCVLDLIAHPLPGKVLILVDTPRHSTEPSVMQAATILGRAGCSGVVYRLPGEGEHDPEAVRADLAEVVSRYIGETEKSLRRVFAVAETGHGKLVFDEPDELFGRRTDDEDGDDRNG